ncbi:hypothetical protein AVEN_1493-1 [Araneus ventricosus]|uniref:Uncharacterized protein n=1 Tax=Araneus ventricosus TaxID=182803 RepID=A0A4Y2W8H6_ARAVE|nr:hypothetical protein AVEN_1493-1 [Araneus ventricosus]
MRSLKVFLKDKRYDIVEEELQFAKHTCEEMGIPVVKRRTVQEDVNIMPGQKAADEPLTLDQELKRLMLEYIEGFNKKSIHVAKAWNLYEIGLKAQQSAQVSTKFG